MLYITIIDWLFDGDEERKRQYCHDDIIAFHIIIPVLQEMIFVSNKNTSYVNDYLNAKHRTTFSSIIKKPEKADDRPQNQRPPEKPPPHPGG